MGAQGLQISTTSPIYEDEQGHCNHDINKTFSLIKR